MEEIVRYVNKIVSLNMDILDDEEWCRKYESFDYPKWTTKDGKKIALCDMSDEHLRNAMNLVENKEPDSDWAKILNQEIKYRYLKHRIKKTRYEVNKLYKIIRER